MRILVFRTGQLGDTLVALPALHAIRNNFPRASITLLYDRHVDQPYVLSRTLLEATGTIDEFLEYKIETAKGRLVQVANFLDAWQRIRRGKFDRLFQMSVAQRTRRQTLRDLLFFRSVGIWTICSADRFRQATQGGKPDFGAPALHEADFYLQWLASEGLTVPPLGKGCMDLRISVAEMGCASSALQGINGSKALVAICAGSKDPVKVWPIEQFQELARVLRSKLNCEVVMMGDRKDYQISQFIIDAAGGGLNLCGTTAPRESAAVLKRCRIYLGNDTGCMHLAAAVGTPCVAIFSSRDVPGKWYPYGAGHRVFRTQIACQGCMLKSCHELDMACIKDISTSDVYAAAASLLSPALAVSPQ